MYGPKDVAPRHSVSRRDITVELVGGLGNQLFGYFAGVYIAHKLGVGLRPFIRPSAKGESRHQSSINSFDLPTKIYGPGSIPTRLKRLIRFGLERAQRMTGIGLFMKNFGPIVHRSSSLGKDTNLHRIGPGCYVQGYFQTYEYHQSLRESGIIQEMNLRNPSNWFKEVRHKLQETKPIIVHVRRGDYLHPKNSGIGALSIEYFREALVKVKSVDELVHKEIWIFSDNIPEVKQEFQGADLIVDQWIEPPAESDPAESLILMSMGSAIVISNSTFSWWAAALGNPQAVIAPEPWFRNMREPEGLIPPDWLRIESSWKT